MFQSTHPRRVRHTPLGRLHYNEKFQSTHPRRVRPSFQSVTTMCGSFNPRTHEGCDPVPLDGGGKLRVSIHAPTKGATFDTKNMSDEDVKFQSTHPRRVRHQTDPAFVARKNVSIHAPTKGATSNQHETTHHTTVSIHAPTKGATMCR